MEVQIFLSINFIEVWPSGKASVFGTENQRFESFYFKFWAYNSVGLEYTPDKRKVSSSNLLKPNNNLLIFRVISSIGRVFCLHQKC